MTPLKAKMVEDLRLCNLSPSTHDRYLGQVAYFARYFGQSPERLGTGEVRTYLLHLEERGLAPSTRNICHAALRFLYTETLGRPEVMATVPRPRKGPDKAVLPLLREEVEVLLRAAASSPFDYTFICTLLDTGLRVFEARDLQVDDIDSRIRLLHVRRGKGGKPRSVKLGGRLLRLLRRYWVVEQPPGPWLFPARKLLGPGRVDPVHRWADHPVSKDTIRERLKKHARRAGLQRRKVGLLRSTGGHSLGLSETLTATEGPHFWSGRHRQSGWSSGARGHRSSLPALTGQMNTLRWGPAEPLEVISAPAWHVGMPFLDRVSSGRLGWTAGASHFSGMTGRVPWSMK